MPSIPWTTLALCVGGAGMVLLWLYLAARLVSYAATKSYFQVKKEQHHGN